MVVLNGGILANLQSTEKALQSSGTGEALNEGIALFLILSENHKLSFLATAGLQSYLGSFYSLPAYLRNDFFNEFETLLKAPQSEEGFDEHYRLLSDFLLELASREMVSGETAVLVEKDLNRIISLLEFAELAEWLTIYNNINTINFSGKPLASGAFRLLENFFSEDDELVTNPDDLKASRGILSSGLDILANILEKKGGGLSYQEKRSMISDEWYTLSVHLEQILKEQILEKQTRKEQRKFIDEIILEIGSLTGDAGLYLAVKSSLAFYLDTFFVLQYQTAIPRSRVVFLYTVLEKNYPPQVTRGVGLSFARHEEIVLSYKDDILLYCVGIVYHKTGAHFEDSFEYFISQSGPGRMALKEMITIYKELASPDLGFLIQHEIPLSRLRRIIGLYKSEPDFYLPLFARVYVAGGAGDRSVQVIEESVPFHQALSRNELTMLAGLWDAESDLNLYRLLELAATYPAYLLPLTAELKACSLSTSAGPCLPLCHKFPIFAVVSFRLPVCLLPRGCCAGCHGTVRCGGSAPGSGRGSGAGLSAARAEFLT